jgi:adenosylcobinamide kinase/adenosylcobinamide-phosphate guanylyltransferase
MNSLILITGGCRSGKSAFAQQLAENIPGERIFIATSPSLDAEMAGRIRRHQQDRVDKGWQTVEETCEPGLKIAVAPAASTILLDCLTLWINNLLFVAENTGAEFTEDDIARQADELARTSRNHVGTVIMVTNEVGLGIVPENKLARKYRDLVGRCNQTIAARADQVYLVSCGIPLQLKGQKINS